MHKQTVSADSDVVSLPFRFTLPEDLPPSFAFGSYSATVRYSLEVVGERPGVFHRNRRVRRVLVVMPAATESQLIARESELPRKTKKYDKEFGVNIRGYMPLSRFPNFPSFLSPPRFLILTLHVVTEIKTLDRSDRPEENRYSPSRLLSPLICFAATPFKKPSAGEHHRDDEPEWIPKDDKERGIWRRSVRFTSTLAFPFAPTSTTETLRWSYILLFTISFPGIGNDLKLEVPVHLGPASACPPPPTGAPGSSNLAYADILPAGPPPMLDLPPCIAAWIERRTARIGRATNQDWDDEKDEKN
ncbi:hypothetical protein B0H14DRAFT_2607035 [Mycena olivaceomarginata]|nr:hypothetical protein B0H14DRAFT_2607035 [Mycena olivaceomarginata]